MLACIACRKSDGEDESVRVGTSTSKGNVKSLPSQLKEMVLKFSGAHRQCKGGGTTSYPRRRSADHNYRPVSVDHDVDNPASEEMPHCAYMHSSCSSSTPSWDFTSIGPEEGTGKTRAKRFIPGSCMPLASNKLIQNDVNDNVLEDEGEPKEWIAQVEPGVQIAFVSLPGGAGNDLKRIRFSREVFNKWQAQRWWGENYDRIVELYNVQRFSRQALPTPPRSDDGCERESYSRATPSVLGRDCLGRNAFRTPSASTRGGGGGPCLPSVLDPTGHIMAQYYLRPCGSNISRVPSTEGARAGENSTSSRDEAAASISISNASDQDQVMEWVEQDDPGVYITIRELPDGTRELRRVRFSHERFGEVHAKMWWEENRERILAQYL